MSSDCQPSNYIDSSEGAELPGMHAADKHLCHAGQSDDAALFWVPVANQHSSRVGSIDVSLLH
jgi:hypothetical protein